MIIHRNWTVKISLAMQETWVWSLGQEDSLEWEMTTHSSILAWRIPMDRGAGGLQSMGSQRVGHDWVTKHNIHRNQAAEIKTRHVRPTPRLGVDASLYFPFSKTDMRRRNGTPLQYSFVWKIAWTEERGRLQSMGSLRVGHDWATSLSHFTFMHWGRKWQSTPVFLPGESQGPGSLVGCYLWGCTESDTTEVT